MWNWYFGWSAVLAAFVSGALLGMFFYQEDFLGGYGSFRRRMLRLGHIALAALGMLNVLFSVAGPNEASRLPSWPAEWGLVLGGVTMPLVCFLSAWRPGFRHLFFLPVTCLIAAVVQTLRMGWP